MHYALRRYQSGRRVMWWLAVVVVLAIGATIAWWFLRPTPASAPAAKQPSPVAHNDGGVTSHLQFVGDVFWGRRIQKSAEASPLHYQYITHGLSKADRAKYDAWIANFECPITTKDVPYQQQTDILRFNCRPEYLPELAKWFTVGGQANNHTMNNGGQWGIDQTHANLDKAGIQYFGNYDMTRLDDICEVVTVPAHATGTHKTVSMPLALCGYMYVVDTMPSAAQLAVMQQYAKVMPVIAFPHMGVEYRPTAEPQKVAAYQRMIDNGADAVVGAHPHVIQNSEVYKGRLIAFSTGNFLFDQQSIDRDTTLGLGVGMTLTIDNAKAAKTYEQVAPSCKAYKDSCLATLQHKLKSRPAIHVAYNFSCYDESRAVGSVPTPTSLSNCSGRATLDKLGGLSTTW